MANGKSKKQQYEEKQEMIKRLEEQSRELKAQIAEDDLAEAKEQLQAKNAILQQESDATGLDLDNQDDLDTLLSWIRENADSLDEFKRRDAQSLDQPALQQSPYEGM